MGRAGELRPFRDEHEKVPIRIGPFDSPDRRPNRMVEATTSCRSTPSCAGSPSLATTHPGIRASRRRSDRGRQAMPAPAGSGPVQSERDAPKSVGSAVESTGRMGEYPERGTPPGRDRRQPSPWVEQHPGTHTNLPNAGRSDRTPNHSASGDLARRKNTSRIQAIERLKPLSMEPNGTNVSENPLFSSRTALNWLAEAPQADSDASLPLHLVVATGKVPHFVILSMILWNSPNCQNTEASRIFQHTIWVWTDVRRAPRYHRLWIDGRNLLFRGKSRGRTRTEPVHSARCRFSTPTN